MSAIDAWKAEERRQSQIFSELSGLQRGWLLAGGTALFVGRLLHAWGLSRTEGVSVGRFTGILLTWSVLLAASIAALWLAMQ